LTTVAVFVPLIFVSGMSGIFFGQLGGIITVTLLASLFCSLMLTPMLAAFLLKEDRDMIGGGLIGRVFFTGWRGFVHTGRRGLRPSLGWALRWRGSGLHGRFRHVLFLIGALSLIGSEFSPDTDSGDLTVNFELGLGTRVERPPASAKRRVNSVSPDRFPNMSSTRAGAAGLKFGSGRQGSHIGRVEFKLIPMDRRTFTAREADDACSTHCAANRNSPRPA
jgi:HAE1 family hydrophobic/amphiphilic exporter-1